MLAGGLMVFEQVLRYPWSFGAGVWGNLVSPRPPLREGLALTQGYGGTRFPHTSTRWEGLGGRSPPKNTLWSSRRGAAQPHG